MSCASRNELNMFAVKAWGWLFEQRCLRGWVVATAANKQVQMYLPVKNDWTVTGKLPSCESVNTVLCQS